VAGKWLCSRVLPCLPGLSGSRPCCAAQAGRGSQRPSMELSDLLQHCTAAETGYGDPQRWARRRKPEPERQRHLRCPGAPDRCVGQGQHAPCDLRSAQTAAPAGECSSTKNSFLRKLTFLLEDRRTTKKTASTGRFSMDEFMRRNSGRGEDTTRSTVLCIRSILYT
jgi:hypothetical protein